MIRYDEVERCVAIGVAKIERGFVGKNSIFDFLVGSFANSLEKGIDDGFVLLSLGDDGFILIWIERSGLK